MTSPSTTSPGADSLLDAAAAKVNEISTLPQIALEVIRVASDPLSGALELKEVIEGDAALSARVLRCVNSSAYALRVKITNLQQAIAYLGVKQVRNLAMTATISRLFSSENTIGPYRRRGLWQHVVSVGIAARMLAMRLECADFEDVFLAGLLHDVGIILQDQHLNDGFREVVLALREKSSLSAAERRQWGFDHTEFGEAVGRRWRFPDAVLAAIRHHHRSAAYEGEHLPLVRCVEAANAICTLKGYSSVGLPLVRPSKATFTGLSLTRNDVVVLAEDLDEELATHEALFQL